MIFHIITLFPKSFDSYLGESIIKRAIEDKKIAVKFYDPKDFEPKGSAKRADDKPYGGGPGRVMRAEPIIKAIEKALGTAAKKSKKKPKIVFLSPSGKQFTNEVASQFSKKFTDIIIICGRYEGVDARVRKIFRAEEISVGPFVLTGGELPAMIILDAVARQVPEVLGNAESIEESRAASSDVYTRPEKLVYKGKKYNVPKVLLSGDHKRIEGWRRG
ncbi:MAG: tRNA (guanosine(37)-N1)-methyltransferase TrmD [Patescibacteria group bacterium]